MNAERPAPHRLPSRGSGYGTTKRGVARRAHVPLAVPLPGRWQLPDVADVRACRQAQPLAAACALAAISNSMYL